MKAYLTLIWNMQKEHIFTNSETHCGSGRLWRFECIDVTLDLHLPPVALASNSNWLLADKQAVTTALHCNTVMHFMLDFMFLTHINELQDPVYLLHEAGVEACELTHISLHTHTQPVR